MVQEKVCWCTGVRVFFWNEKLTRNQISEEEGLCVIIIRRKYQRVHPCPCYNSSCFRFYQDSCSTAIPFDLSMLINKDPSLFLSATLQFTPKYIIPMSHTISSPFQSIPSLFSITSSLRDCCPWNHPRFHRWFNTVFSFSTTFYPYSFLF